MSSAHPRTPPRPLGRTSAAGIWLGILVCLLLTISACGIPAPTGPDSSPRPSPSRAASPPDGQRTPTSSTIPAAYDLFVPGRAQQVVAELVAAAGGEPAVRLILDRTHARLTCVDEQDRPHSLVWREGAITPSDDGTDLVAAASFDPTRFNLSDVASLFTTAARLSGSSNRQELQINEYARDRVYMTITTTPESSTVFFDLDANLIPRLDLTNDDDLALGISDVVINRLLVVEVGIDQGVQVWADVVTSPGMMERRTRPVNQPMYLAQRRETPGVQEFDATLIDPAVLGRLLRTAPGLLDKPPDSLVTLRITQPPDASEPRVVVSVGGSQLVTDLTGAPLAEP